MGSQTASAIAHPNIAFIKYWGNRDENLRLPMNGSISMNLFELSTRTMVTFDSALPKDIFDLNGVRQSGDALKRVSAHLDLVRGIRGYSARAHVLSENNFPSDVGIASSAAAFAALTVAAVRAAGIEMTEKDLSRLARRGSGSAARSIPGGFVEWFKGTNDGDSYARSIATQDYWNLTDVIALVSTDKKKTTSTEGHFAAHASPIQAARVQDAERRLTLCRSAILARDFTALAEVLEQDSNLLHAVTMTSIPSIYYWLPVTLEIMNSVRDWRKAGIPAAFTIDAGPNVHVICEHAYEDTVKDRIGRISGVQDVILTHPGENAHLD